MKTRGIVMEVNKKTVTVITKDGRFCRLPKRSHVEIGQEYAYHSSSRPWMSAAAVLVFLVLTAVHTFNVPATAVAYVTVDINPSLELGVSKKMEIVSVVPMNDDAINLLDGLKLKGLPLEIGLDEIFKIAKQKKYIHEESPTIILAGMSANNENKNMEPLQDVLNKASEKFSSEQTTVKMSVVSVDKKTRDDAKELGVSAGKYMVLQEGQAENANPVPNASAIEEVSAPTLNLANPKDHILKQLDLNKLFPLQGNLLPKVDIPVEVPTTIPADNTAPLPAEEPHEKEDEPSGETVPPPTPINPPDLGEENK